MREVLNELILAPISVPAAATATPPAPNLAEQLQQLATLRDQGILTEAEFTAKKADILARL